jgi:hypothetical protein
MIYPDGFWNSLYMESILKSFFEIFLNNFFCVASMYNQLRWLYLRAMIYWFTL